MRLGIATWVLLATATVAAAQDDEKVKRQAEQEKLQSAYEKSKALPDPAGKDVLNVPLSNNGIKFKSADGRFEGAVGGRIYTVFRHILENPDALTTTEGAFVVDTARINIDGTFHKAFGYRVELEGAKNTAVAVKEAFTTLKLDPDHELKLGLFKTPFSQEETCSSRWIEFAERSICNRVVPAFDVGLLYTGWFADKVFQVEAGFFNGSGTAQDANDEKDLAVRLRYSPLSAPENLLRLGVAVTIGDQDSVANADITNGDLGGITVIDYAAGVTVDGVRRRTGFEFCWILNSFQVRGEYFTIDQDYRSGALDESARTKAWYVQVSYLLTGEVKPLENRVKPANGFDLSKGTWGAWELALRIANLDVSDADGTFIIATANNQKVQELTFGVNWWWSSNTRVMLDLFTFKYDEDLVYANGDVGDTKVVYLRWQFDF